MTRLAEMTGFSIGHLSELERGLALPPPETAARIEEALGMVSSPPPRKRPDLSRPAPAGVEGGPPAWLGACLAVVREVPLSELARATDMTVAGVREALRELSEGLAPWGLRVVDDGMVASLQPRQGYGRFASALVAPRPRPPLTELQQAVLMMAVYREGLSVAEVSTLRGVNSWAVVEALAKKGYLVRVTHQDGETVYQPTHLVLEMTEGVETFEQLRALLGAMEETAVLHEAWDAPKEDEHGE